MNKRFRAKTPRKWTRLRDDYKVFEARKGSFAARILSVLLSAWAVECAGSWQTATIHKVIRKATHSGLVFLCALCG